MQKVFLTATIAISLTVSTIVIICSLDGLAVCNPSFESGTSFNCVVAHHSLYRFYIYKDYCILPYITRSHYENNLDIFERITLTFHLSYDYFDSRIVEQVEAWDGPITLLIMIQSDDIFANIRNVESRIAMLSQRVVGKLSSHIIFYSGVGCDLGAVANIGKKHIPKFEYPVNVVRNAARMFVRSKFILMADYEYVFSNGFESRMRKLAQIELMRRPKTALVFRIFEVDQNVPVLPRNKSELLELMKKDKAIEFHAKFSSNAHKIPGLSNWFKRPEGTGQATIFAEFPLNRHDWEPQFVSLNTIPLHDENFPFSVRDNTVLRWEMCRMGYTFAVVDDLFMVHRGIKTAKDVKRARGQQINARAKFSAALNKFKKRMDREYPETKSNCPKFRA